MNILKKIIFVCFFYSSLFFFACSKEVKFSGIYENSVSQIFENYQNKDYTKEEVSKIIGEPLIQENSGNLWIFRMEKKKGNSTFNNTIYNKTLKLKFENNVLRSVEEINLN